MKPKKNYRKKLILALFFIFFLPALLISQGVVITEDSKEGMQPHESAIFDVRSTDKGILIPSMNTIQREAILAPANGLLVYDTDENQFFYFNALEDQWVKAVGPEGPQGPEGFLQDGTAEGNVPYWDGSEWVLSSNNLFHDGTNVGIGTDTPETLFHLRGSGTSPIQIITNTQDQLSALALNTQWRTWLIGQNRPPGEAVTDAFFIHDVNANNTRFLINIAGNVGIGTTAPTQRLDVDGNLRLRSHLVDVNNTSGTTGQVLTRGASGVLWADPEGSVGGSGTAGKIAYWESATDLSALPFMQLNEVNQFVEVTSKAVADDDDPIFEVKNKDGQVVFGVYQTGVRIYVDDSPDKSSRGGFAVGGFTAGKDKANLEYLRVTPDSVRVYVMDGNDKSSRGGFAVGGFTAGKGFQELLRITSDSARIYVSDDPSKSSRGGFAVGGFTAGKDNKSPVSNFMYLTPENYFIGHEAGANTAPGMGDEGRFNSFIGYYSGNENITGRFNTFMGYEAGLKNKSNDNTFIGYQAGKAHQHGGGNIHIGSRAGEGSTNGIQNIFIGEAAGSSTTYGRRNVFVGYNAGFNNTGSFDVPQFGSYNIFIGNESGFTNKTGYYNVFLGEMAGFSNTGGSGNVFLGNNTGANNKTGSLNVFIGTQTGFNNAEGTYNSFVGFQAGYNNTSGDFNSFYGYQAGYNSGASSYNTAMGYQAGYSLADWQGGTYVGFEAGKFNTGRTNVFVGSGTGRGFTSGEDNTAIGAGAGGSNDAPFVALTGHRNTYVGINAGYKSGNATNNVIVGAHSIGASHVTGSNNVYLGYDAGNLSGAANGNVFIGNNAGKNETRSNQLYIANSATNPPLIYGNFSTGYVGLGTIYPSSHLHLISSGAKTGYYSAATIRNEATSSVADNKAGLNVQSVGVWNGSGAINYGLGVMANGGTNNTGISVVVSGGTTAQGLNVNVSGATNNYAAIFNGGRVGVGTSTPTHLLDVQGNVNGPIARLSNNGNDFSRHGLRIDAGGNTSTGDHWFLRFFGGSGSYYAGSIKNTNGILDFHQPSDKRIKMNISNADFNAVEILKNIRVASFQYKDTKELDMFITGYIAQEVQSVFPEMVSEDPDTGILGISTSYLIPVLHKAVQEQQDYIKKLESRIEQLEKLMLNN